MADRTEDIRATIEAAGRRRGRRLWTWLILALLAAGAGLWWVTGRETAPAVVYTTEPSLRTDLVVTVTATGTVEPTTEVEVASELSGILAAVAVDFNDSVTAGQELARLDTTRLAAAQASAAAALAAAEARRDQARTTLAEAEETFRAEEELDQRGVTTHRNLMAAEAAFDRAVAALAIAEADVALARSNLGLAGADLAKAVIRSPIDGVVLNRAAEVGQIVGGSAVATPLFVLAENLAHMELQVDVDEADIGRIAAGQGASFTVDAFGARGFPAAVTEVRFAPEQTDGVVTYKAILSVDNPDRLLRPGMTATATITVAERPAALVVPNAALRFAPPQVAEDTGGAGLIGLIMPSGFGNEGSGDGRSLWVLEGGVAVERSVTPGDSDGRVTEILAGELAEGEPVITDMAGTN